MNKLLSLLLISFALLTIACEKSEIDPQIDSTDDPLTELLQLGEDGVIDELLLDDSATLSAEYQRFDASTSSNTDNGTRFNNDCFSVVFPIDIEFPDGSIVTAADAAAVLAAIRTWRDANPGRLNPRQRPRVVFPVDVVLNDGTVETIDSRGGFRALLASCRPDQFPCYRLSYPVSIDFDGTVRSFDNITDRIAAMEAYRQANPNGPRPQLVFPLDVVDSDGEITTVASLQMLRRLQVACRTDRDNGNMNSCIEYVFPIELNTRTGTVTVNNNGQLRRAFSGANRRAALSIVYPINVIYGDETLEVLSARELLVLIADCRNRWTNDGDCLRYAFPIDFNQADGTTVTVDNRAAFFRLLASDRRVQIVYPITVTLPNGNTVELNNLTEYRRARAQCP